MRNGTYFCEDDMECLYLVCRRSPALLSLYRCHGRLIDCYVKKTPLLGNAYCLYSENPHRLQSRRPGLKTSAVVPYVHDGCGLQWPLAASLLGCDWSMHPLRTSFSLPVICLHKSADMNIFMAPR